MLDAQLQVLLFFLWRWCVLFFPLLFLRFSSYLWFSAVCWGWFSFTFSSTGLAVFPESMSDVLYQFWNILSCFFWKYYFFPILSLLNYNYISCLIPACLLCSVLFFLLLLFTSVWMLSSSSLILCFAVLSWLKTHPQIS